MKPCKRRSPLGQPYLKRLFTELRANAAKYRGLECTLTYEDFKALAIKNCFYCNARPKVKARNVRGHMPLPTNGIDRIDSALGYNLKNCVSCCGKCNMAKGSMRLDEFFKFIGGIYERHGDYIEFLKGADDPGKPLEDKDSKGTP